VAQIKLTRQHADCLVDVYEVIGLSGILFALEWYGGYLCKTYRNRSERLTFFTNHLQEKCGQRPQVFTMRLPGFLPGDES
jgi:hypothetical protein